MELRDLEKVNPTTADFRGLSVTFNPDAFTDGFYFSVAERFRQRFAGEVEAAVSEKKDESTLPDQAQSVMRLVNAIADRIKSIGETIEGNKRFHAALLAGTPDAPVILQWDLTHNGVPVPCNEEGFLTLKPKTLEDLWIFVRDAADPKSQGIETIPQSQTMNETTPSHSASPETPPDEDRLM